VVSSAAAASGSKRFTAGSGIVEARGASINKAKDQLQPGTFPANPGHIPGQPRATVMLVRALDMEARLK